MTKEQAERIVDGLFADGWLPDERHWDSGEEDGDDMRTALTKAIIGYAGEEDGED